MPGAARLALGYAVLAATWLVVRTLLLGDQVVKSANVLAADAAFLAVGALGLYLVLRARDKTLRGFEERLSVTTDTYADWYWKIDAQLRFTYIQGAGLARFGIEPADVLGKPSSAMGEFRLVDMSSEAFARLRAERKPYRDVRASLRLPDGKLLHVSINGEPVVSKAGTFLGYRGITRDITTQVEAEQALQTSERRFRSMVETVPHLVFFITNTARDRWDFVSGNLAKVWNYSGPLTGKALSQLLMDRIHPEDRARFQERAPGESRGELVTIQYRVHDPDRGQRWLSTCSTGVRGADGEIEVYGVTEDVTDRHMALERITASENMHRSVLEGMAEGLVIRDAEGRIVSMNRAAERMLDTTLPEMRGMTRLDQHGPSLHDDNSPYGTGDRPWESVIRTGRALLGQNLGLQHRDGSRAWLRINAAPLHAADGKVEGVISTLQDITAERAALAGMSELAATLERRVEQRTDALIKTNRELEAFAHSVSHDLRAPLRAINGFARLLAEREGARLDGESRRLLSRVEAGAGRMGELIDDVIAYSGATRRDPGFARVDLDSLAKSVVTRLSHAYPTTRLEVGPLGTLHADARMVEAILEALVGNALKFSAGATRPEVRIHARAEDGETIVQVTDNGTGFDMAHAGHLFSLFKRLHHDHEFPGNGVGLATVRNLVERQGGTVEAMGEPGRGATFSFRLRSAPP